VCYVLSAKVCNVLSAKVCREAPREICRDSQGEQKCNSKRELRWRESVAIVCRTEVLQRAAKSFQWECHTRRRIKRDSVLSVLFFMCESALGCTWVLGLERVLLSQTL
jgi:hypothetical protein